MHTGMLAHTILLKNYTGIYLQTSTYELMQYRPIILYVCVAVYTIAVYTCDGKVCGPTILRRHIISHG